MCGFSPEANAHTFPSRRAKSCPYAGGVSCEPTVRWEAGIRKESNAQAHLWSAEYCTWPKVTVRLTTFKMSAATLLLQTVPSAICRRRDQTSIQMVQPRPLALPEKESVPSKGVVEFNSLCRRQRIYDAPTRHTSRFEGRRSTSDIR